MKSEEVVIKSKLCIDALAAWSSVVSSPPVTEEIGAMCCGIESRQGIGWKLFEI
jgi:hypothetical protein